MSAPSPSSAAVAERCTEPSVGTTRVDLPGCEEFATRHIGIGPADERRMLDAVAAESRGSLIAEVVPPSIARTEPMQLPPPLSEAAALEELKSIAGRNRLLKSFIGQGYHGTHTPGGIQRKIGRAHV